MTDLRQLSFSLEIKKIVDEMMERFEFSEALSAIKFGFAYAIKYHQNEIKDDEDHSVESVTRGLDYSVSSFSDREISNIIAALYPEEETPFRFLRTSSIFGLRQIKSKMDSNPFLKLTDLL